MSCVHRNVLSSQEVVDFIGERMIPDQSGKVRALSSIVEEVGAVAINDVYPRV